MTQKWNQNEAEKRSGAKKMHLKRHCKIKYEKQKTIFLGRHYDEKIPSTQKKKKKGTREK